MLHYNVWFSFKEGVEEKVELNKVTTFLDDLMNSGKIENYRILKTRSKEGAALISKYHAPIEFKDDEQFNQAISGVSKIGVHSGLHGIMIGKVKDFKVEVFDLI
jgi:hypothetical protein